VTKSEIQKHPQSPTAIKDEYLGQASIPAVNQYLALAKEQQLDLTHIYEELNFDASLLTDSSNHIAGSSFQQLILALINQSNDDLFGLHTAEFVQPGSYSVLGFILMNCENLGEAISKIQPFEKLVGDMGTTHIEQLGEQVKISWKCLFNHPDVKRHMIDNCLASWVTFARYLVNQSSNPSLILLTRKQPPLDQQQEYQRLFKCDVKYAQAENAIVFDKALLALPLHKGDKNILTTLESHANAQLSNLNKEHTFLALLRLVLEEALNTGETSQQYIAQQFGISTKTLQRRLAELGIQYQTLLDDIRLESAKRLLTETVLTLDKVSAKLGFKEPRSFYRWFNKLENQTPGKYREKRMQ